MAFPSRNPTELRVGALMMLFGVPALLYASYVRRGEPEVAVLGVFMALVLLGICGYALRRAARLQR